MLKESIGLKYLAYWTKLVWMELASCALLPQSVLDSTQVIRSARKLQILAREPTLYSIDAFNALARNAEWTVDVLFATARNWAPDAGHQFEFFPNREFVSQANHSRGWQGQLTGIFKRL